MTAVATLFVIIASVALLLIPRRWAALPLLASACYMTLGQGITVGPFHFPIIRMALGVGFIRVLVRSERPAGGLIAMDWLMVLWGAWALCASVFHADPNGTLINQLGRVYNSLGIYFLIRCFCRDQEDVIGVLIAIAVMLLPIALEMLNEQLTQRNLFSVFGGVPEVPQIRQGRIRAQGPFAHSILAGTVGAVCAPFMAGIWRRHPLIAKGGLAACLLMVVASASSGPLTSLLLSAFALVLWRWRHLTRQLRVAAVLGYLLLDLVMKAPAYYLIARIDLAGGSTGWHRARLIESAIEHFREWWWAGTDYTRHWMPYGVSANPDHADITNHYLFMGVMGGLPMMLLFMLIVWWGFRYVGEGMRLREQAPFENRFLIWALGCSLFSHATTCLSVSYFDQSFIFIYLTLAMIVSLWVAAKEERFRREHATQFQIQA